MKDENVESSRLTAIIVDDEPHAREALQSALKKHTEVDLLACCVNGLEAVKAVNECGCTPATKAKATASGTSARATVRPERTSTRMSVRENGAGVMAFTARRGPPSDRLLTKSE